MSLCHLGSAVLGDVPWVDVLPEGLFGNLSSPGAVSGTLNSLGLCQGH